MYINISTYRFTPLDRLPELRQRLSALCEANELKGTILLSPEGINVFAAGRRPQVEELMRELRTIPGLGDLTAKESPSDHQPFGRMLVKIKKEIIAFGVETVNPARHTSPKLTARELKQWLDEGRPVTLLDTRNEYEVKMGTFAGARSVGIDHFREFPAAVKQLPDESKKQPLVMFCTGGIRCEKAGPYLESLGFEKVHQLDGGILKYFEECGGAHYQGECFVFDERVGVDSSLKATGAVLCASCQMPVTVAQQHQPEYIAGKACPYCFSRSVPGTGA